jgi:hypothetical protein
VACAVSTARFSAKGHVTSDATITGLHACRTGRRRAGDELDRQAPVIDDIEQQMDKVTKSLKTNNAKLKGIVSKMRSSRNFCVDIILITVLLAIGAYIYAMFM